jgi:hypothetical protein
MDAIGSAMLMIFDELKNDKPSKSLIKKMDTAQNDATLKDCAKKAVARLRELDKPSIANEIEKKLKGFAF